MLEISGSICDPLTARTEFLKVLVLSAAVGLVLAISVYSPYIGGSVLALFLATLILGINLRWSLVFLIFLLPFDPQIEIRQGFFLYFDLFFGAPFLAYLWGMAFNRLRIHRIVFVLVPYVLFAMATSFWRVDNMYWFLGYGARLTSAVLFMAVVAELGRPQIVTLVLGATLVPQVIFGIYQVTVGELGPLYFLIYPHYQEQPWTDRAYGFFFQPNNFGSYCATISLMLLALASRATRRLRISCYVLAAFGFIGLAASGSRGAWVGAIAGLALLFLVSGASLKAKLALSTSVLVGIVTAQSIAYLALTRAQSLDTYTVQGRLTVYLAALLLFVQHPLIGVGLTNYQVLMPSVVEWDYGVGTAAHNMYLQILSENGIIGFLLFFGPFVYLLYKNAKRIRESTGALLCSVGLTVVLIHGLFDFQFAAAPQYLLLFATLFGLSCQSVFMPVEAAGG